jgi:TolB-like protein/Flp pilus assembly protein TadD
MSASRLVYEFGDFRLDVAQRQLLLKTGARPLPLTSRAFETLLYLIERRGELLDKTTLMRAIWPNVIVEENSLNQNISLLRRVLGECPGEYRFIVTVPGRGYRFVAPVRTIDEFPDSDARMTDTSDRVQPRTGALARTPIAVLPFTNLTGDVSKDYLGDAVPEELINTLVQVRWFKVASRTSTFAFQGRNVDVRQIARDLDVEAVLEGSIRAVGEGLRVTAQLVDGRTGHHLWSETYERDFEDLSKVQDEITVAVVDAIAGHFVMGTTKRKTPTRDLKAYQLYLQAMMLRSQPTDHNLETVMLLLERALVRDPDFARAWYALAETRAHIATNCDCNMTLLRDVERDARRALALDPSISSAYAVLGLVNACCGRWIDAEAELRQGSSLVPRNPETLALHAVYVARQAGHRRRALDEIQSAYELAPASPSLAFHVGVQKLLDDDVTGARRWIDAAIANGYPRSLVAVQEARAELAMRDGRCEEAAQTLSESLSPASRAAGGFDAIQLFYSARSNPSRIDAAIAALQAWAAMLRADMDHRTAQRLIVWFTMLGTIEAAHDVAERALDRLASSGTIGNGWGILWTKEMQPFRNSQRFQALVSRLGFSDYWRQYGPPDDCTV